LLHEAHTRVTLLVKSLKESEGISVNDAYDAPQDARLAHQNGEYDILYNMLEHLGPHAPYVIEGAVRGLRVDSLKNTAPFLTADQMNAATSVRKVILDRHRARIQFRPDDESPYYAYAMTRLNEVTEILELMERGIREPSEIEPLLEQKRTVEKSLSGGVL
jgi:hypothetical protein